MLCPAATDVSLICVNVGSTALPDPATGHTAPVRPILCAG